MKYKEIKLKDNKSILVEESAEINKGCKYYDGINIGTAFKNNAGFYKDCDKIIATINHSISLDVPMIVIEDEGWESSWEITNSKIKNGVNPNAYRLGWLGKSAQQKGVYSEEDLINLVAFICNKEDGNDITISESGEMPSLIVKQFIQSLNQEYIELEMDCDYLIQCHCTSNKNCLKPTIKTNRIDGQLISYTKK